MRIIKKYFYLGILLLCIMSTLNSCKITDDAGNTENSVQSSEEVNEEIIDESGDKDNTDNQNITDQTITDQTITDQTTTDQNTTDQNIINQNSDNVDNSDNSDNSYNGNDSSNQESGIAFNINDVPTYSGDAYCYVNNNVPYFSDNELTTEPFETYSDLDSLGRCGTAYANICTDIMPTEERGEIGQVKPSGWHTVKYDIVDGKYLYNRCHLIAYSLAGENANVKNLITGTRYLNITGMTGFENKVANYVESTNHHVLYRVTPIFEGNNLLTTGVLMEGRSVEDNTISFCVFCYNVQPGVVIDYTTGDSSLDESVNQVDEISNATYILNSNTMKFHKPTCSSVTKMSEKNKMEFNGTREEAINMGYSPCKNCNP